jgi:hypothetical protein
MNATRTRKVIAALVALALAGAVATLAFADVVVYKNSFSSKAAVKEVKKAGGKKCKRKFVSKGKKRKFMRATLTKSPGACTMTLPVQGDSVLPDYTLQVAGKVAKRTAKSLQRSAYLAASVRVGPDGGYELRVFPKKGRFELARTPNGEGFPVKGESNAVARIGKKNKLTLTASGATLRAVVNGDVVARVTDSDPGGVTGTRLRFAAGNARRSGKNTVANFQKLRVSVPDP